ncbi:cytochrome P450 [Karstenula rhodostoma CBS 690.94]|uniref:Cytochrome P450 n=1 Tax=Karstenula rhodostoma CBS 690.94 TaxID=1392251 RepID=A0A9P4PIS1_9PLEO|nr:cytochrome P450 [Karstenula rhodostoma CBS 690.94]
MLSNHSSDLSAYLSLLNDHPADLKPSLWPQVVFALLLGVIVHYIMLQRCPTGTHDSFAYNTPPRASLIGCLSEASLESPLGFVRSARSLFWRHHPVWLRLFGTDIFVLQGGQNITAMLKDSSLSAIPLAAHLLKNAFRMPSHVINSHYRESEFPENGATPMHTKVRELNRKFLTGPQGAAFADRFRTGLKAYIQTLEQKSLSEGVYWEDFADLFRKDLTAVVLNAMCGDKLLQLSPGFLDDFWEFNDSLIGFLTYTSWISGTRKYAARDRVLLAIERWQTAAARHCNAHTTNSTGADPHWGSSFFRERYDMMQQLEGYDAPAMAVQELAFLYALNSNAVIATFWTALEVFKDADLLDAVRTEVESCRVPGETMEFDTDALLRQPVLQAVYAEVLRLRGHGMFVLKANHDVNIQGWMIPKGSLVLASSTPAHMDSEVWCTDGPQSHPPVDVFWPRRFLQPDSEGTMKFSQKATEGSWAPFGGGVNPCPGRQFAKLQAILTVALLVSRFDCRVSRGADVENEYEELRYWYSRYYW